MQFPNRRIRVQGKSPALWLCTVTFALLAGCASAPDGGSIYVPVGGGERAPEQRREAGPVQPAPGNNQSERSAQQPQDQSRPSHRTEGQSISPAAVSLIRQADQAFKAGNITGGMALLQRAQRISPDAPAVYYKMAEGYVLGDNLARAEQFAMKGVSVAGANERLQKSGWQLLSDIRRARGNVAGADDAEARASAL